MSAFPEPLPSIFVAAFGLVVGSFLNVCIYRLPVGDSVVHPRSRCPSCKTTIVWYRNIPVLSWFLLRGKCGDCGHPISFRYPFVEALGAATLLMAWIVFGAGAAFPIVAAFALALLVLFFTDLDHQLLPDAVTLGGTVAGLAVSWFNPFRHLPALLDPFSWWGGSSAGMGGWLRVWAAVAGAVLGAGLLWGVGAVYGRLRGVEAMGLGDVKMMAMVGAFTGPLGVVFTIFAASLVGALVGVLLIPLRGRSLQDKLPFGCFLAPAALAAILFARRAFDAYVSLLLPPS